jgi:hypothetical protein
MSEPRNDYGFPLLFSIMRESLDLMDDMNRAYEGRPSKNLERAQAIAAEVRARRFPPVQRITNPKD